MIKVGLSQDEIAEFVDEHRKVTVVIPTDTGNDVAHVTDGEIVEEFTVTVLSVKGMPANRNTVTTGHVEPDTDELKL